MQYRALGNTGLMVSVLGLGTGEWGDPRADEPQLEHLLARAIDLGITLIDTAPSYGLSEERLGRMLASQPQELILSTKVGYGIEGVPDWTPECIRLGVDRALRRLRRDCLDIVHLHSCPAHTLECNGVLDALHEAREAGKIRVVAYSGENEALDLALRDMRVGSVMSSLNLCDQRVLDNPRLQEGLARGCGWLVKRPLCNAVWRHAECPQRPDLAEYWRRWHALSLPTAPDTAALAMRFVLSCSTVSSAVVGSGSEAHLLSCVAAAREPALEADVMRDMRAHWHSVEQSWPGLI